MTVVCLDYCTMHVRERANLFHLTREKVHETVQLISVLKEWRINIILVASNVTTKRSELYFDVRRFSWPVRSAVQPF